MNLLKTCIETLGWDTLEILRLSPGWMTTNTRFLVSQHWFGSAGGTCTSYSKHLVEVLWESDAADEDGFSERTHKRQLKLTNVGFTASKRKTEEIESSGKGRCKFFQSQGKPRELQQGLEIFCNCGHSFLRCDGCCGGY